MVKRRVKPGRMRARDRKSTRLNSSYRCISYAVFCLKKKNEGSGAAAPRGPHPGAAGRALERRDRHGRGQERGRGTWHLAGPPPGGVFFFFKGTGAPRNPPPSPPPLSPD